MRITLPAVALIVTGSSVVADSQSYPPAAHVRALGMRALHKARSQTMFAGRKMEANDMGEMMNAMVPTMCGIMEMDEIQEGFDEGLAESEVEGISITCPVFGCDDAEAEVPNLVMECSMDGVVCEEDEASKEKFCITDTDIQTSMGLNFVGDSQITSTQCSNYTSPDYMADMGRGCWDINVTLKMGDMVDDITSGEYAPEAMTEEEATAAALEYFEINECSVKFEDGTTCECGLCNEGKGYHLLCTNQLASQDCTNFDTSAADLDVDAITNGDPPAVSVMRLLPTSEEKTGAVDEEDDELDVSEEDIVTPGTRGGGDAYLYDSIDDEDIEEIGALDEGGDELDNPDEDEGALTGTNTAADGAEEDIVKPGTRGGGDAYLYDSVDDEDTDEEGDELGDPDEDEGAITGTKIDTASHAAPLTKSAAAGLILVMASFPMLL